MAIGDIGPLLASTSMTRLRAFLEEREDVILSLVDHDLRLVWASSKVSGRRATELVHADDAVTLRATLQRALAGETASCNIRANDAGCSWKTARAIAWPSINRAAAVVITVPTADPS